MFRKIIFNNKKIQIVQKHFLFVFKSEFIVELNMNFSAAFFRLLNPKYLQTQESK